MSDLLDLAIDAHGGWSRWEQVKRLRAHIAVGGGIWRVKGWVGAYADINVVVDPHLQRTEFTPFLKAGQRGVYEPERTAIVNAGGETLEQRQAPRGIFSTHNLGTPWDAQHLIYFTGYAMWNYLTAPFLFKAPGFKTEEIEPWEEEGAVWRRLKVTFPAHVHTHSTEQVFYFDAAGLLRRQDYSVEIMGGTSSANYSSDHRSFNGLVLPTKRRVYSKGPDNRPLLDRLAVSIDFHSIDVE